MTDSNTQKVTEYRGGIGFLGLLAILFIGLKLTGYISWSWIWVLAPLWIPFAIWLAVVLLVFVVAILAIVFAALFDRK